MWQRFTEKARKAVFYAQEEAGRLGENIVGPEHVLLGLLREPGSIGCRLIERMGVSLDDIHAEVEKQAKRGEGRVDQDMQLSPGAKKVIDLAYDEARKLNNNYIGTEHLLLGLIRESDGLAGMVLAKLGVELDRTRQETLILQGERAEEKAKAAQHDTTDVSELRAHVEESIGLYAIVEQLKTLIATQKRIEEKLDKLVRQQRQDEGEEEDDGPSPGSRPSSTQL